MKKIVKFLFFVVILLTMFGMIFLTSAIYDTVPKLNVETFFFQSENEYVKRTAEPIKISDFKTEQLRNMLLEKYLIEYFYVVPNEQNIILRQNKQTPLWSMSTPSVFEAWQKNVLPEIKSLAENGVLRMVKLVSIEDTPSDMKKMPYSKVEYELKTWEKPNDLLSPPVVSKGTIFMRIHFLPYMMKTVRGKPVLEYLESGKDPAGVFSFGIADIANEI